MGRFRGRLRRLERETEVKMTILVCPECSKEFVAHGDVALEVLAEEWARGSGSETHRQTAEDILRIFDHEHNPTLFVDKASGAPFLGRFFAGMELGVHPDDIEDLSEP